MYYMLTLQRAVYIPYMARRRKMKLSSCIVETVLYVRNNQLPVLGFWIFLLRTYKRSCKKDNWQLLFQNSLTYEKSASASLLKYTTTYILKCIGVVGPKTGNNYRMFPLMLSFHRTQSFPVYCRWIWQSGLTWSVTKMLATLWVHLQVATGWAQNG
jgi:hypothetical protein